jgi:hypothetical protein
MAKILLISEQKLKSFTSINKNVDMDLIRAEILVSQDIYLQQVLGTKFLNHLYSKVNSTGNTFNSDEKTLVDEYIAPFLIQQSYATLIPSLWARTLNRGIMTGDAESASSIDVETMKYLKSIQQQKSDFYKQRLVDYLTCGLGQNKFPEYLSQTTQDGMKPDKQTNYQSPIVLRNNPRIRNIENYSEDEMMFRKKYNKN